MCEISVVVPVYNVQPYLEKCINSIINQTFKDIEIILVDDGSSDNSGAICDMYQEKDSRVKVIHKKNGGLSSARNMGLIAAHGRYISFIDSDDWIKETMYEKTLKAIKENEGDIVQCRYIRAEDENIKEGENDDASIKKITRIQALNNLYRDETYLETVVTWNKLYKKELFDEIRFPEGKINEDEFTTHKLLYKSRNIILYDEIMYYYRQTPNSITNSKVTMKRLDKLEAIKERMAFFLSVKNRELYGKTVVRYGDLLRGSFTMCKYFMDNNETALKDIDDEYRRIFKQYINNQYITIGKKILGYLFYISPNLGADIQKIRGKARVI